MVRFTILLIALIAFTGFALSLGFKTAADRHALLISAGIATAVQLTTFGLIQLAGKRNTLAAWGMGAIFRGTILVLYGTSVAKSLGLPLTAALTSFAIFLFVSMLLESLLISYAS